MAVTKQSWSVIIFCYNEAGTVLQVIESVQKFFEDTRCTVNEIVIVDDGSTDGSAEIIREAEKKYVNIRTVFHPRNLGIGKALRSGYAAVKYENVTAVPADAQFDVTELYPFAEIPEKTFVSFFRKENTVYSLQRNILSWLNKKVNSVFLGIRLKDVNWVKIFRNAELQELDLHMKSSLVETEIASKLLLRKNKLIQVESVYHRRKYGTSKGAGAKVVFQALRETIRLIFVIGFYRFKRK